VAQQNVIWYFGNLAQSIAQTLVTSYVPALNLAQNLAQPNVTDYHGWIDIKDIVWPGNALKPPEGIPEKRFIRVKTLLNFLRM